MLSRKAITGLAVTLGLYALAAYRYTALAREHPEASTGFHGLLAASTLVAVTAIILIIKYIK